MNNNIDLLDQLNNIMKSYENLHKPVERSSNEIVFNSKETYYYNMVKNFFKTDGKDNIDRMKNIIDGKSDISLRLLDWFVTRYADQHKIRFQQKSGDMFNIHISYKAQLRSYKKKYFDPFRRRKKKFYFKYIDDNGEQQQIFTTIGQLNFFRWIFANNLIEYILENKAKLLPLMNQTYRDDKLRKLEKKKITDEKNIKKKLSIDDVKIMAKQRIENNQMKIILNFE